MEGIVIKTEPGMIPIKQEDDDGQGPEVKVKMEKELRVKVEEGEPNCGCDCFKENKLLKEAILELGKGKALLEDFLQVEFGDKFEAFVKKRDQLISLGLRVTEDTGTATKEALLDSRDLTKRSELVILLSVIKDSKTEENTGPSSSTSSATPAPPPPPKKEEQEEDDNDNWEEDEDDDDDDDDDWDGEEPQPNRQLVWETPAKLESQTRRVRICPVCQAVINPKAFTTHLITLHQDRKVQCPNCHHKYIPWKKLAYHLRAVHKLSRNGARKEAQAANKIMLNQGNGEVKRWLKAMRKEAPPILIPRKEPGWGRLEGWEWEEKQG